MSSSILYQDASAAIDWLCRAFGFEVRIKVEGDEGRIVHSELTYGDDVIMVVEEDAPNDGRPQKRAMKSPKSLGVVCTKSIILYFDDGEARYQYARSCGAQIVDELSTENYGDEFGSDCSYGALDLEGHMWWITQRMHTVGK